MRQQPQPLRQPKIDWELVRYSVARLQFLDESINWWLLLLAKLAEPMLIFGVVYVGIKLYIPAIATSLPWLENTWIVTQSVALDISGPGAFVLAKQARAEGSRTRARWAQSMGIILIALAIVTVSSAAIEHTFAIPESRLGALVVALLIVRSAVSVGYSVVCRLQLSEPARSQSEKLVKAATVLERLDATEQRIERIAELVRSSETMSDERTQAMSEQLHLFATAFGGVLSQLETNTVARLRFLEEHTQLLLQRVADAVEELDMRQRLSLQEGMEDMRTGLDEQLAPLAAFPALVARLDQIEERSQEQFCTIGAAVEQTRAAFAHFGLARPNVTELRPRAETTRREQNAPKSLRSAERAAEGRPNSDGDKGAFVRQCLTDDPAVRNTDIGRKAAELGLTISPSYISETRKAFFEEQVAQRSASFEEGSA